MTRKLADGVSRLWRRENEQAVINDEAVCFNAEGSPSENPAQPEHREAAVVILSQLEGDTSEGTYNPQYCPGNRPGTQNTGLAQCGGVLTDLKR